MPAPKNNQNAAITDGTVPYTPNPRVRCLPEYVDIIRDLSPADRGRAMGEWYRLQYLLKSAMQIIMEYTDHENTPAIDLVLNEIDAYFIQGNGQGDE